jgi:hypothetical protein
MTRAEAYDVVCAGSRWRDVNFQTAVWSARDAAPVLAKLANRADLTRRPSSRVTVVPQYDGRFKIG